MISYQEISHVLKLAIFCRKRQAADTNKKFNVAAKATTDEATCSANRHQRRHLRLLNPEPPIPKEVKFIDAINDQFIGNHSSPVDCDGKLFPISFGLIAVRLAAVPSHGQCIHVSFAIAQCFLSIGCLLDCLSGAHIVTNATAIPFEACISSGGGGYMVSNGDRLLAIRQLPIDSIRSTDVGVVQLRDSDYVLPEGVDDGLELLSSLTFPAIGVFQRAQRPIAHQGTDIAANILL